MYSPFKGGNVAFSEEANWNNIQTSTRWSIELAFGILKGRWKLKMK